jgi:hypothetical protein
MIKRIQYTCLINYLLIPVLVGFHLSKLCSEKQQPLLQLCLNGCTVVKGGIVDQDNSLLTVKKKNHLIQWPVITKVFADSIAICNAQWIDKPDTKAAVVHLAILQGIEHLKFWVLTGACYAFQPGFDQNGREFALFFLLKAIQEGLYV